MLNAQYLLDRGDDMPKNIIFGDDVGVSLGSIDDNKLVVVLIVPDDTIDPVSDQFEVMVRLSRGEEEVDFAVLMLKNKFGAVFVGKHS